MTKQAKHQIYCTNCFKSLGVESRMDIFRFLAEKQSATVSDVVDFIGLTQPTVSYHLLEMKKSGLLESKKKGKEVYYSVSPLCPHEDRVCALKNINLSSEHYVQ